MLRHTGASALALALGSAAIAGPGNAAPSQAAPDPCATDCFVLTSVSIQGVTAYALADLATTYDSNLARRIGDEDLVQTATAITDKYRSDGYFLTRAAVGPRDRLDGSASILVYEGYIGEVVVEGAGAASVAPLLESLAGRRPLTIGELDRRLALASDVPGIKLTSRIEPMLGDPAQHRLVIDAQLQRFDAGLHVENRGSESQGPWQAYVTTAFNSAFQPGDQLRLSALTTPERTDELTFGELIYSAPMAGGRRIRGALSGYTTDAPPTSSNGWLGARSVAASVTLSQPVIRSRSQSLWANATLDARRVEQAFRVTGTADERLSVARFSLSGERRADVGYVAASVQVSQGLDLFGATTANSASYTRNDADGQFTKANLNISGYRDIGRYAGVYGQAAAQWSDDSLLGSEEFFAGGAGFGRAYNYGEISGDEGVAAMVELRIGWNPKVAPVTFFQIFGFVDAASVSNRTPTGGRSDELSSAGAGLRLTFDGNTTLKVEFAKPLSRTPFTESDNGWRAFLSLSREF